MIALWADESLSFASTVPFVKCRVASRETTSARPQELDKLEQKVRSGEAGTATPTQVNNQTGRFLIDHNQNLILFATGAGFRSLIYPSPPALLPPPSPSPSVVTFSLAYRATDYTLLSNENIFLLANYFKQYEQSILGKYFLNYSFSVKIY